MTTRILHRCGHVWEYDGICPRCHYCGKSCWSSEEVCPACDRPNHLGGQCLLNGQPREGV